MRHERWLGLHDFGSFDLRWVYPLRMTTIRFACPLPITLFFASSEFGDSTSDAERTALANYKPDVFKPREVEACSMTGVLGLFPVHGGHDWVFGGSAKPRIVCDRMPKLTVSRIPTSVLRGTEFEGCALGADSRLPETVQLIEGIPHHVVSAWAVCHKGKAKTEAPCEELDPAVICEHSPGGELVCDEKVGSNCASDGKAFGASNLTS